MFSVAYLLMVVHVMEARGRRFSDDSMISHKRASVAKVEKSMVSGIGCPWGYTPKVENLHIDFRGSVPGTSKAVHLLLNPQLPTLIVYANARFEFKLGTSGEVVYHARKPKDAQKLPPEEAIQKFTLTDMVSLKFHKGQNNKPPKLEFKYNCDESDRARTSQSRGSAALKSRGSASNRPSSSNPAKKPSFIQLERSKPILCRVVFRNGLVYHNKKVKAAMSNVLRKGIEGSGRISYSVRKELEKKKEQSQNQSIASGTGFHRSVRKIATMATNAISSAPLSAAERIFQKLWCLSQYNTCAGHPCFTRCTEPSTSFTWGFKGKPYLVPYGKDCTYGDGVPK